MNQLQNVLTITWNTNNAINIENHIEQIIKEYNSNYIFISIQEHYTLKSKLIDRIKKVFKNKHVYSSRLFGIWSIIISDKTITLNVTKLGLGLMGIGNKGAIITIINKTTAFVSCHLTPHVNNNSIRMEQINKIFEVLRSMNENKKIENLIIAGDFNFRIIDHKNTINYSDAKENDHSLIFKHNFSSFLEPTITFEPTYKYLINSDLFDASRTPSWCDRIFCSSIYEIKFKYYTSMGNIRISDHRPVILTFNILNEKKEIEVIPKGNINTHKFCIVFTLVTSKIYENIYIIVILLSFVIIGFLMKKYIIEFVKKNFN